MYTTELIRENGKQVSGQGRSDSGNGWKGVLTQQEGVAGSGMTWSVSVAKKQGK